MCSADAPLANRSSSRIAERLKDSPTFWSRWLRRPSLDVAEAIVRLRRLRGISQAELAERIGSKQPAIARIEGGRTNVSTATLVKLADALGSTVTIRMDPEEMINPEMLERPWWERAAGRSAPGQAYTFNFIQQFTFNAFGVSAGEHEGRIPQGVCIIVDAEADENQSQVITAAG